MNVNPSPAHTLDAATAPSAVPGSRNSPGALTTGNRSRTQPMLESTPTLGWSRNSHIRLATATDVATVDEKMARNAPTPRTYLSARAARPTPSTRPIGTVISANLPVTATAWRNSLLRSTSRYWSHPLEWQFWPCTSQRYVPEPDRLAERVDHEGAEDHGGRGEQQDRRWEVSPAATPSRLADGGPAAVGPTLPTAAQ